VAFFILSFFGEDSTIKPHSSDGMGFFLFLSFMNDNIFKLYQVFKANPVITTDSRMIQPGSIFFALQGDQFNGNDYAIEALQKGAVLAVVDQPFNEKDNRLFRVTNVLETLQQLAAYHRTKLKVKIIAITGSNGKTSTKELTHRVLSEKYKTIATKGNLNNHIGVPLTLLALKPENDFGLIEMGANHPGEIATLCTIAQPDYGIITNVGKAHLEGFGSFEGVVKAKTELYTYLKNTGGSVFINSGNEHLLESAKGLSSFSYGKNEADCLGEILSVQPFLTVRCRTEGESYTINTRLVGKYNFENIMAAVCIGTYFKVSPQSIKNSIESYEPSNNRSQLLKTQHNTVILDAYNANPSSMKAALENFADSDYKNKVLILGDMFELGAVSKNEHAELIELIENLGIRKAFLTGPFFNEANNEGKFVSFNSVQLLEQFIRANPLKDCTVLLKGSRKMQLEKIVNLL
jgi:UDP-N-acetylmuramoyl-tripeptide--D-alanyl-D-alanine ligase